MAYKTANPYKKLYKVNFASLSNLDLAVNGDHTIDGYTWTSANMAAASSFSIVNGTGLVMTIPAGATVYNDQTRTCPIIHTNFSNFIPDINFQQTKFRAIRILFKVTTTGTASNTNQAFKAGFEWFQNSSWLNQLSATGYNTGISTTTKTVFGQITPLSGSAFTADLIDNTGNTFDIIGVTFFPTISSDFVYGTSTANVFPGRTTNLQSNNSVVGSGISYALVESDLRIAICAQPGGAASSFTSTVTDMEIDLLQYPTSIFT